MPHSGEAPFYHALSIHFESSFSKLHALKEKYGKWEIAFREENIPQGLLSEFDKLEKENISLFLLEDDPYPSLLKEIPHPPLGIYVEGKLPEEEKICLAIVGTRKATPEGKTLAFDFAKKLAENNICVVSGLALGIDAAAHEGALQGNGLTLAVLASGLHYIYPKTNENLAKKMLEKGAIISEYPPDSPPLPYRFLERNRIVSGLSRGILVVEAPSQSGSLATARFAMEQNRDVFVIPGSIRHPNFKGSNKLIREGGILVTDPEDILQEFGINPDEKQLNLFANSTPEETLILEVLRSSQKNMTIDEIQEATKLHPSVVNQTVSFLILQNRIQENGAGYTI